MAVPGPLAVTSPVADPTEAIEELLDVQVPPVPSVNNEVPPTHALAMPLTGPGVLTTVSKREAVALPQELETV